MSKKPKKESNVAQLAEAPARIRETHVRDRLVDERDREPRGWRNVTWPVEVAYLNKRLNRAPGDANVRWFAIREYDEIFQLALCRSGRDSTAMDIVSGGSGFPISEEMQTAIRKLISIDSHMSSKDRQIVRKLCEGFTLPESVKLACGEWFTDTVIARVCDALDALDEALTDARNNDYRYVRMK